MLADFLDTTCDVEQKTPAADGYGGRTVTWAARHSGIRCHFYASTAALFRLPGGAQARSTHRVIMEPVAVDAGDRLKVESDYYEVLGPSSGSNVRGGIHIGDHVEVFVRAV